MPQETRPSAPGHHEARRGTTSRPVQGRQPNRLVHAKSPYLRQHASNPVDWYPWGEEAFQEARRRGVPVFLSIGYSTCHWCHVMEHESFEDEPTAAYMNAHYVCVKLDREERPDVDSFYMSYVIAATQGSGGWPASIFMTADKRPFYAGTYFPKEARFGRPSFMQVLEGIHKAWVERRDAVERDAARNVEFLAERARTETSKSLPAEAQIEKAAASLFARYDAKFGGFRRGGPKFPSTTTHELMFLASHLVGKPAWAEAASLSLMRMCRGGIYDHVGGGFHRYAVDARWLVPHFEKMLYDQARIAATLLEAWRFTGEEAHARVAEDVIACVLRDFRAPEGAFMCAFDADSGGHEGTYYVWSLAELGRLLDEDTLKVVRSRFALSEQGNWKETPGRNIVSVRSTWDEVANQTGISAERAQALWTGARPVLRSHRNKRPLPGLDDKILSGWNGLMITALSVSGRTRGHEAHLDAARTAAGFVLSKLRRKDGTLIRRYCRGEAAFDGVLRDYAFTIQGLLDLFEATGEVRFVEQACSLAERCHQLFADPVGGFFDSPATQKDVLVRPKEFYDGAIPAGNGYLARALIRLGALTGRKRYGEWAAGTLKAFKRKLEAGPWASPTLLHANRLMHGGLREIVIVGEPSWPSTRALRGSVNVAWLPDAVLCFMTDEQVAQAVALMPLLAGKSSKDGKAVAYVCHDGICKLPVTDPRALEAALRAAR